MPASCRRREPEEIDELPSSQAANVATSDDIPIITVTTRGIEGLELAATLLETSTLTMEPDAFEGKSAQEIADQFKQLSVEALRSWARHITRMIRDAGDAS